MKVASPLRLLLLWTCLAFAAVATPLSAQINISDSQQANDFTAKSNLTVEVTVAAGVEWAWGSTLSPWLTTTGVTTRTGSQPVTYAVATNDTGASRTGTLTFTTTSGGSTATLEVTQLSNGDIFLELGQELEFTDATAKSPTVSVFAAAGTEWGWSSDQPWLISTVPATQSGSLTFSYRVAANETLEPRSGSLTFSTTSGGIVQTLEVIQEGASDSDGDGIADADDLDSDNDGTPDAEDAFPFDPSEDTDTDKDGIGNNADPDDDGDGILDAVDPFPQGGTARAVVVGGQTLYIPWTDIVDVRRGIVALRLDSDIIVYINGVRSGFPVWGDADARNSYLKKLTEVLALVSAAEAAEDRAQALMLYMMASVNVDELISKADSLQDIGPVGDNSKDLVKDKRAQDIIFRDLSYLSDYLWLKML